MRRSSYFATTISSVSGVSTRIHTAQLTWIPSTCTWWYLGKEHFLWVIFSQIPTINLTRKMLQFHFRPTPHPGNVRRRIKQLKDYINVTSDWISYALIDDITDAFGPLIQGIEYEVDSIDELVLILKDAEQSDMLRRYVTQER